MFWFQVISLYCNSQYVSKSRTPVFILYFYVNNEPFHLEVQAYDTYYKLQCKIYHWELAYQLYLLKGVHVIIVFFSHNLMSEDILKNEEMHFSSCMKQMRFHIMAIYLAVWEDKLLHYLG